MINVKCVVCKKKNIAFNYSYMCKKCYKNKKEETMKEKGRQWDGRSRVPTDEYKKNYDEIFKKEKKNETSEDKKQDTSDNRQDN
jgi:hypothetical protein